ncbi:MAG: hypothetical protein M3552_13565 [Planctomycetota bacterium]|nr:hypothetical protein [Planctomycetaceae bacterium]MDQ3331660.1 hypothetical protein [Planctomycetota bacterium]
MPPLAIYAPEIEKTFFVSGGSRGGERYLLAMALAALDGLPLTVAYGDSGA